MSFYKKSICYENERWTITIECNCEWIALVLHAYQEAENIDTKTVFSENDIDQAIAQWASDTFEDEELIREAVIEGYELMPDEYYRDPEEYPYVAETSEGSCSISTQETTNRWTIVVEFDEQWVRSCARKFIDMQFTEQTPNYAVLPLPAVAGIAEELFKRSTEHMGYQIVELLLDESDMTA